MIDMLRSKPGKPFEVTISNQQLHFEIIVYTYIVLAYMRKHPYTFSQACIPPSGGSASGSITTDLVDLPVRCVMRDTVLSSADDAVSSSTTTSSL
jgi:hypothetical protein